MFHKWVPGTTHIPSYSYCFSSPSVLQSYSYFSFQYNTFYSNYQTLVASLSPPYTYQSSPSYRLHSCVPVCSSSCDQSHFVFVQVSFPVSVTNIVLSTIKYPNVHGIQYSVKHPAQYTQIVPVGPDASRPIGTVTIVSIDGIEICHELVSLLKQTQPHINLKSQRPRHLLVMWCILHYHV